ncbi:MAG: hypothetical protein SWY16_25410 [Cyanobacteriota bacterium]|nr:hypothetical protein [Cyanobacteriota bacterium]
MSNSLQTRLTNYLIAQAQHGDLWAIDILGQWEREIQQNLQFETGWLTNTHGIKQTSNGFSPPAESEFQSEMPFPAPVAKYS